MYASRRDTPRQRAKIAISAHSEHNFFTGFTENISEGGVFLCTHQLMEVGSRLTLTLTLKPYFKRVEVQCEVRWHRRTNELTSDCSPGMGLMFLDLPSEVQVGIERFMADQRESMFVDMD